MSRTVAAVFSLIVFGVCSTDVEDAAKQFVLSPTSCNDTGRPLEVDTPDAAIMLTASGTNETTEPHDSGRDCKVAVNVQTYPSRPGLQVVFVNNSECVVLSLSYFDSNHKEEKQVYTAGDKGLLRTKCLTSSDDVFRLTITYRLKHPVAGKVQLVRTKGVQICSDDLRRMDDAPPDDPDTGSEAGEPKIGSTTEIGQTKEPPLDVIIAIGVVACSVVGLVVAVLSVRRWIRNNAAEERRQSAIRVNSHGSHTRSTSNSMQSNRGSGPDTGTRMYGSVGGRLPSASSDTDPLADAKSVRTMVEEV